MTKTEEKYSRQLGSPPPVLDQHSTVSAKTISTHKMHLMQKLGLASNAELIRYAIRHGLPTGSQ